MSGISFQVLNEELQNNKFSSKEVLIKTVSQKYNLNEHLVETFVNQTIKLGFVKI